MDDSKLPQLKRAVRHLVQAAAEPDGAMDKGEFTFQSARAEVTRILGLDEGALDGRWKKVVKEEVNLALEALDDDTDGAFSSTVQDVPKAAKASPKISTSKTKKSTQPVKTEREPAPKAKVKRRQPTPEVAAVSEGEPSKSESDEESDMSSVYDAPVKEKKKRKSTDGTAGKAAKGKKPRTRKDPNEGLSPEERKIADLKRIVHGCGTVKKWAKEFEGMTTAKSQISHLKRILSDLGMEGTPTLAKAKTIKRDKEEAAELKDIQAYEAERGRSAPGRPSRTAARATKAQAAAEGSDDDGEEREPGATDAVLAFLGSPSDDSD
ncbi:uncharacterized protein MKK02DRAFT_44801 [Dioszegia hungarica]|uniref:Uncharacterized protein n=1 Tax=Dioszegia hungarica TaxID=4972 RepID=A0AA38H855_9TREE|nr:uncharacterized protein MKK02DRAFT_44801 [Dioszegia hungarica]KAI9636100.1 hypothetical protein MKK02DRAFT_44801 [Dioszegia hungarica]